MSKSVALSCNNPDGVRPTIVCTDDNKEPNVVIEKNELEPPGKDTTDKLANQGVQAIPG